MKRRLSKRQRLKNEAWRWCSRYVKLRDAIEYTKTHPDAMNEYAACCTCGKVLHIKGRGRDAGHFIGRSIGGSSGVYFEERNIHFQCMQCNQFRQGAYHEYEQFMVRKYGQEVVEQLRVLHKTNSYSEKQLVGLALYYRQKYEEICKQIEKRIW